MRRANVLAAAGAVLFTLTCAPARAQGGPPLLTDDPDTPGPGYWEINVAIDSETSDAWRRADAPNLDMNYGAGTRTQLKFEMPWVVAHGADVGGNRSGIGNALAGVKWRFL